MVFREVTAFVSIKTLKTFENRGQMFFSFIPKETICLNYFIYRLAKCYPQNVNQKEKKRLWHY